MKLPLIAGLLLPIFASSAWLPGSSVPLALKSSASAGRMAGDGQYKEHQIQGWTVFVEPDLQKKPELRGEVLDLLGAKLYEIRARVPKSAVQRLQQVKIFMHLEREGCPGGVYHPSEQWLIEHDVNPEMAQSVEFGNARNFLSWMNTQPSMVLHEMAHAFHHQVLSYEHAGIKSAFEMAKTAKSYDAVLYAHGQHKMAYAMNNPMEYFAEASEAWFGVNDFYPFVRAEFREHDAPLAKLMDGLWQTQ